MFRFNTVYFLKIENGFTPTSNFFSGSVFLLFLIKHLTLRSMHPTLCSHVIKLLKEEMHFASLSIIVQS